MSNNESDLSKMSNPDRQKELDDAIESFHQTANEWLKAINKDHEAEKKQLKDKIEFLKGENGSLKKKLAEFRKKFAEAKNIPKKTIPPTIQNKVEEEYKKQIEKLEAENAGYKKANEDVQKEIKEIREQNDLFFIGIRCHENMATKLKDKVSMQFGQLNQLRSQVKDPQIPESFLKEEIEEMWSQSVKEAKILK